MGLIPGILTALGLNKVAAYVIEVLVAAALVAGAAFYVAHLYNKAAAFDELSAEHDALEVKYGCDKRPSIAERELTACLIAHDLDAEKAQREGIERERDAAAKAQEALDQASYLASEQLHSENAIIYAAPTAEDGAVPKVLLDAWARERKRLGGTK